MVWIRNASKMKKVTVNESLLSSGESLALAHGDIFIVGDRKFRFEYREITARDRMIALSDRLPSPWCEFDAYILCPISSSPTSQPKTMMCRLQAPLARLWHPNRLK